MAQDVARMVVGFRNNVIATGPLGSRHGRTCDLMRHLGGSISFPPLTFTMWHKMSLGGFGGIDVLQLPGHLILGSPDCRISQIAPDKRIRFGGLAVTPRSNQKSAPDNHEFLRTVPKGSETIPN